jgi:aminodeoxyfutalosine synthase
VHIQAFTASEIAHLAHISGKDVPTVLSELKEAGLGSLPGGGAEVFSGRVRDLVCQKKISGETWLNVMRAAHSVGLRSNATMLYGHVEQPAELADHLVRLRALQDETGGFDSFIPLAFHPANTGLAELPGPTGFDDLKMLAVGRLVLDNFKHIKAFWINIGLKLAQVSLAFGVDDLDGTVVEEKISHSAGAATDQAIPRDELVRVIRGAGRTPVERDTLYNVVRRYDEDVVT